MNTPAQPNFETPSLGDILQLQATIEALPAVGLRDIGPSERINVSRNPGGVSYPDGTEISLISLSQRVGDSDRFSTAMNYVIIRDGDESTTRLIKRPPFRLPKFDEIHHGDQTTDSAEGKIDFKDAIKRVLGDIELHSAAGKMGLYDITVEEVQELKQTIVETYSTEP